MPNHRQILVCLAILTLSIFTFAELPVAPGPRTIEQPDGSELIVYPKGTSARYWIETKDGYSIEKGSDGYWYFAVKTEQGKLQAGSIRVDSIKDGKTSPPATAKGLKPDPVDTLPIERKPRKLPKRLGKGTINQPVLVILANFNDISTTYSETSFHDLIFGATDSVKEFFLENSYNQFTMVPATESVGTVNDGIISVSLGYDHPDLGSEAGNRPQTRAMMRDIVTAADAVFDFSAYDDNGDNYISEDELSIVAITAGYEASYAPALSPNMWGHQYYIALSGDPDVILDGVELNPYTMFGERHNTHQATMGIIAHELGHLMLGLPDLYDANDTSTASSNGIGKWGLMGSGSWNVNGGFSGNSPAHLSAWSKITVGFATPDDITGTQNGVTITPANQAPSFKRMWIDPYKIGEYFLLEVREQADYDTGLPGEGLLIWHIDESQSNNYDPTHKLVDLEEADGLDDLDNETNRGDSGDPYPGTSNNTTFDNDSTPNSKDYDGSNTGIGVSNISSGATYMVDLTGPSTNGDHIRYDNPTTIVTTHITSDPDETTAYTALVFENTTTKTTLDGIEIYCSGTGSIDFFWYESLSGNTPSNLLHSQTGFTVTAGWNRLLLTSPQSFPQSSERLLVLFIDMDATDPLALDVSAPDAGRSYISNAGSSFSAISYDLSQVALLSGASCTEPTITSQPSGDTICEGDNHTFTVTATGDGLSYQWKKNGVDIGGATSASYTVNSATTANAGSYTCVITGDCGNDTSSAASLTVNETTAITVHPVSDTICPGDNASFSVTASGSNLTYQWKKNGSNIIGATSATLNISAAAAGDEATYTCVVSGDCGDDTSAGADLSLNTATAITTHPEAEAVCEGDSAIFTVAATGTNLTYQWQKNGVDIPGQTSSSLNISPVDGDDVAAYRCVVTGDCGDQTSTAADLTITDAVAITSHPAGQNVCVGDPASFSVSATGSGLSYQWKRNGISLSGATSSTYNIAASPPGPTAVYTCEVTSTCGTATSNGAALVVSYRPTIDSQPADSDVCEGDDANFAVGVSGDIQSYQWQKNGVDIPGATSASLVISPTSSGDAGDYRCVITGDCDEVTSDAATLSISSLTVINSQPQSLTRCETGTATFTVGATGSNLTYQWYKDGMDIPGETSNTLVLTNLTNADDATYNCEVVGDCGTEWTETVILTIDAGGAFEVFVTPESPVQGNDIITLMGSISCGEDPLTWEWENLNNNTVVGNEANLVLDPMPLETTTYRVTVSDNGAQTDNREVTLLVSEVTVDVNGDGNNTIEDLWEVILEWTNNENPAFDADGDGLSTILDLLYIRID